MALLLLLVQMQGGNSMADATAKSPLFLTAISLFTSMSTLVCCTLPALFVALGAGAVLAGLVTSVPQLVWLSTHKVWVFSVAGILLALAGAMQWKNRHAPCPADAAKAALCSRLRRINKWLFGLSVAAFVTGAFFEFVAVHLF